MHRAALVIAYRNLIRVGISPDEIARTEIRRYPF
jgi:hypothetical protein